MNNVKSIEFVAMSLIDGYPVHRCKVSPKADRILSYVVFDANVIDVTSSSLVDGEVIYRCMPKVTTGKKCPCLVYKHEDEFFSDVDGDGFFVKVIPIMDNMGDITAFVKEDDVICGRSRTA